MTTLAIDLETYSDNPIQYGVHRYVDTPAFEILLLGYAFDDEPVEVADLTTEGVPARVRQALFDNSVTKTAFNANFEITCLRTLYPDMPDTSWECSSVLALYNSLPTGLANVAKILKLGDDQQKDTRGKALIRYFSLPCKPTKANGGTGRPTHRISGPSTSNTTGRTSSSNGRSGAGCWS
jgi:DNA polymerase